MSKVELVNWNPRKPVIGRKPFRYFVPRFRTNNFGDLIGPLVVDLVRKSLNLSELAAKDGRIVSVGSIMHLAKSGDVIWGTGVNGKKQASDHTAAELDVRAVRGPHTRQKLQEWGHDVPAVFGDPALLLPFYRPEMRVWAANKTRKVTVVPNLNDLPRYRGVLNVLDPRSPLDVCLRTIAESELVVGSSLHGIVVAESLGIPARLVKSGVESDFKYRDYYGGTGRDGFLPATSVPEAISLGGDARMDWDHRPLLASFPGDMFLLAEAGARQTRDAANPTTTPEGKSA